MLAFQNYLKTKVFLLGLVMKDVEGQKCIFDNPG